MRDVLVVDDNPDMRGMLGFTLSDLGFEVREAKDGNAALAELEASVPDCMVLDLMMPGLDGFSVLEVMRARGLAGRLPVVILSGDDGEKAFVRGWDLGAVEYLTKPVDPYVLAAKVFAIVEQAERLSNRQPS